MSNVVLASAAAPPLGIIGWVIIGGLAGWVASKIMGTDASMGVTLNVLVGIIGGFLGGWLLGVLGFDVKGGGKIFSFFTCLVGSVVLLWIVGMVKNKK
ncbi:GlsB/YeaQ/YmgE family stress response membrane protein [Corynebacterium kroppenstedtii]|uniref:GlsB/YeaQ/YmgE family stress response membrane protein n=1 Tax=Corynebacterium sp. PCR 32 TaxID=3351342 RepID=UPI00309C425C